MASPSGRACEVSTKDSCSPIFLITSPTMGCSISSKLSILFFLLDPLQQLLNPCLARRGGIELKEYFGRMPQPQPFHQLMPDESSRCIQALQGAVGFLFAPIHFHKHSRRFSVGRKQHFAHRGQPNARITQFALNQGPDLITQSVGHALTAMLYITILHKTAVEGDAL